MLRTTLLVGLLAFSGATAARAADYAVGADLSFLKQTEDTGFAPLRVAQLSVGDSDAA